MRIAEKGEDLRGKVCICSTGRIAVVSHFGSIRVGRPELNSYELKEGWHGVGLDGQGNWFSSEPAVASENLQEFHQKLEERFQGKMTRHV